MTVTVTFPNGISWTRDYTTNDECLKRRNSPMDIDADVTRTMVRWVLCDSGLFTDAEAHLFTEDCADRLAAAIEKLGAKRE